MPNTYSTIATTNLSGVNTYTFNSIGNAYTDIILVMNAKISANGSAYARVNNNTGTNYSLTGLRGTGTSAVSYRRTNDDKFLLSFNGFTSTATGQWILQFQNYTNSTTYKTMLSRFDWSDSEVIGAVGTWRVIDNISDITVFIDGTGTFSAGSTVTLYGIAAA
jgi:hypothetical protein